MRLNVDSMRFLVIHRIGKHGSGKTRQEKMGGGGGREGLSQSNLCDMSIPLKLFIDWLPNGRVFSRRTYKGLPPSDVVSE